LDFFGICFKIGVNFLIFLKAPDHYRNQLDFFEHFLTPSNCAATDQPGPVQAAVVVIHRYLGQHIAQPFPGINSAGFAAQQGIKGHRPTTFYPTSSNLD
jgi:hypothetical protein